MTAWTKELPKESGFYWWREDAAIWEINKWAGASREQVVLFTLGLSDQWTKDRIFIPGNDYPSPPRGEFWPIRLLPPDEAQQAWRESDQTFADIKTYLESLPAGSITIHDPELPMPFPVKLDPDQPCA